MSPNVDASPSIIHSIIDEEEDGPITEEEEELIDETNQDEGYDPVTLQDRMNFYDQRMRLAEREEARRREARERFCTNDILTHPTRPVIYFMTSEEISMDAWKVASTALREMGGQNVLAFMLQPWNLHREWNKAFRTQLFRAAGRTGRSRLSSVNTSPESGLNRIHLDAFVLVPLRMRDTAREILAELQFYFDSQEKSPVKMQVHLIRPRFLASSTQLYLKETFEVISTPLETLGNRYVKKDNMSDAFEVAPSRLKRLPQDSETSHLLSTAPKMARNDHKTKWQKNGWAIAAYNL